MVMPLPASAGVLNAIAIGCPPGAFTGYHAGEFTDTRSMLKSIQVIQGVAAFRDAPG
ncbi:hypothetical protein MAHJHV55_51660 [Mycobacterium avium subsp. hominissuis]